MRLLFSALLFFSTCSVVLGQEVPETGADYRRQAVFLELFGNSLVASINYDVRLARGRQDGHGIRFGLGGFPVRGVTDQGRVMDGGILVLPLSYNYLLGGRRSSLEAGAGITPIIGSLEGVDVAGKDFDETGFGIIGFLNVGYRYQPLNRGPFFRFTWSPGISSEGVFPLWFGLSLGYSFK